MRFKNDIYRLAKPTAARIKKYNSAEQCGTWNEAIVADFESDAEFICISNQLHEQAVASKFPELPVMDGNGWIRSVEIEFGKRLCIHFELSFLSPWYFIAPAFYQIQLDEGNSAAGLATYGCGKLNQNGEFCTANSKHCVLPDTESGWAVLCSCRFGDSAFSRWLPYRRSSKRI